LIFLTSIDNASSLGIDPKRIGVFGNDAGANLALATSLKMRDLKESPLSIQILCSGLYDASENYESVKKYHNKYGGLIADMEKLYWRVYLNEGDEKNPYACPLVTEDLSGLPRTIINYAEFSPARSQSEILEERLKKANRKLHWIVI
jgi:acetyl esterase